MDHPFKVGKEYRNRRGTYEVLSIDDPKMRVRYANGREMNLTIAIQAQIWENIELLEEVTPKKPKRKTRRGYEFSGLQESDFKDNVTGTHWRSRGSLGGRLAQHLSETTRYEFQSYSIYRRPSVYIVLPDYYDPDNGIPYAKFELRLFPEGAQYGFYVERADESRAMGLSWHWWSFLESMEGNEGLRKELLAAMQENNLYWRLQKEEGEGKKYTVVKTMKVPAGESLLWEGTQAISWSEFLGRLREVPAEQWLNVRLCAWMQKKDAVEAGVSFAEVVTGVFRAALPLYLATTGAK